MGIKGLLESLKPFKRPVHVSEYAGQRVGIDAYSWLHKGVYACSMELCEQGWKSWQATGSNTMAPFVKFCMHRVDMLRYNKVIPVVVFDGGHLPLKAATDQERQRRREKNLELARYKLSQGDKTGAYQLFQRAVNVSPAMANELVKVLKANGVEFIVAPYEADAQLAWLSKLDPLLGGVSAVISEDSDLLTYGCPVVFFKMDKFGNGEEIRQEVIFSQEPENRRDLSFRRFTPELFVGLCVMAGCDFLPSIPGIGIRIAHTLIDKYRKLERVLSTLLVKKSALVPGSYIDDFNQAVAIFSHARVYDANKKMLTFLNPLPRGFEEMYEGCYNFLGPDMPPSRAKAIALGLMDPTTMCAFDEGECAPAVPASLPQLDNIKQICSPTSVLEQLEVVDLSDSEDADCFMVPGVMSTPNRSSPTRPSSDFNESFPAARPVLQPFSDFSNLPAATHMPDMNFLTLLHHIAFDVRGKQIEESGRFHPESAQQELSVIYPQNNPFKRQKVSETKVSSVWNAESMNAPEADTYELHLRSSKNGAMVLDFDAVSAEDTIGVNYGDTPAMEPASEMLKWSEHQPKLLSEHRDSPELTCQQQISESSPFSVNPPTEPSNSCILKSSSSRRVLGSCLPEQPNFVPCRPPVYHCKSPFKENENPMDMELAEGENGSRSIYRGSTILGSRGATKIPVVQIERKALKHRNRRTSKKIAKEKTTPGAGIMRFFQPISK